jgi:hypothetical protein
MPVDWSVPAWRPTCPLPSSITELSMVTAPPSTATPVPDARTVSRGSTAFPVTRTPVLDVPRKRLTVTFWIVEPWTRTPVAVLATAPGVSATMTSWTIEPPVATRPSRPDPLTEMRRLRSVTSSAATRGPEGTSLTTVALSPVPLPLPCTVSGDELPSKVNGPPV